MIRHAILKKTGFQLLGSVAVIITLTLSSCASGSDGGQPPCTKCIDNKPAATAYSNTINAINHNISLDQGRAMIHNFGNKKDSLLAVKYRGPNIFPVYETFNLKAIDSIICQPKAIGFRIYLAMDDQQKVRFVLVGVDGDGKDIIQRRDESPSGAVIKAEDASVIVKEAGQRWP